MNVYLCHTPLHVLITALETPRHRDSHPLYLIVEDVLELHKLAGVLLSSESAQFVMLPGSATIGKEKTSIAVQKSNANVIRERMNGLSPNRVFIFFDQRAEAQALLNHRFKNGPKVTWLEDGITAYSVARPFSKPIRRLIRNKLRFGISWRGSRWLGSHPKIDEVRCFFPALCRAGIRGKKVLPLSRSLDDTYLRLFMKHYGKPKFHSPFGAIVVPHPDSGLSSTQVSAFIDKALDFCENEHLHPLFKVHPRDNTTLDTVATNRGHVYVAEQTLPLELILFCETKARAVIGFRTSALHVTSAIHPLIATRYYEPVGTHSSEQWHEFYEKLGIPPL